MSDELSTIVLLASDDQSGANVTKRLTDAGFKVSSLFIHKGRRAIRTNAEPHQVRATDPGLLDKLNARPIARRAY